MQRDSEWWDSIMIGCFSSLILGLFIFGCVAIGLAWRSDHTGNHPICSTCGFDLHGQEPLSRCPECGQDGMERGGGYYYGRRAHNRRLMTVGVVCISTSLSVISITIVLVLWFR